MDTRSMKILSAIVDEYIRTGEPVGSKALAEKPDISVSSATIRNTMAALEQEGYLDHPHTSATECLKRRLRTAAPPRKKR